MGKNKPTIIRSKTIFDVETAYCVCGGELIWVNSPYDSESRYHHSCQKCHAGVFLTKRYPVMSESEEDFNDYKKAWRG